MNVEKQTVLTPIGEMEVIPTPDSQIYFLNSGNIFIEIDENLDINSIDFAFITKIVDKSTQFEHEALELLLRTIATTPEKVGLKDTNTCTNFDSKKFIDLPLFTFRDGENWDLLFQECNLPIGAPYGILITGFGEKIVGFENLSDAEVM